MLDYILKQILGFLLKHILETFFGEKLDDVLEDIKENGIEKFKKNKAKYKNWLLWIINEYNYFHATGGSIITVELMTFIINLTAFLVWLGKSPYCIYTNDMVFAIMFVGLLIYIVKFNHKDKFDA